MQCGDRMTEKERLAAEDGPRENPIRIFRYTGMKEKYLLNLT